MSTQSKPTPSLIPPFTLETAILKIRLVEDNWNSRDPERVARGYAPDTYWRNRSEFIHGREEVVEFLKRKWAKELDYRLIKELWSFDGSRIAVRFAYESHDASGQWFRSYGNENWEFDAAGLSKIRHASINDVAITEEQRLFRWPLGRRPDDHPSLTDLNL
jgi:nuclear transport factor 2 (NTF2) superfamily protein